MILTVPTGTDFYPTLGPQIVAFMEQNLVFGPGDLRGQPLVLDDERLALIYRLYEVYPAGHPLAGRRLYQRGGLSLQKGSAKTELAALLGIVELHPEAPVRCVGFSKDGEPIGGPVVDPYIALIACTEQQSDELAYGAMRVILENSPVCDDFDIGLERIERRKGDGKAVSLASNPDARDGGRTTFGIFDETHRFVLPRQKRAYETMKNNLGKRKLADPWMIEISTAPEPGAGSVAEATMEYAQQVAGGLIQNASFFFFHRQASDDHDLTTIEGARAAVIEAAGPSAAWRDIDSIVRLWNDPTTDRAYWERVWCNRLVQGATQAFNIEHWKTLKVDENPVKPGDPITLGFDGAMFHDSTGIVATHVKTGFQWVAGLWECPAVLPAGQQWQVPTDEVDQVVRDLFDRFNVCRLYADPPYWQSWIAAWSGDPKMGPDKVVEWWTNRRRQMTTALENFTTGMRERKVSHAGDARLQRHLGNARRADIPGWRDEQGKSLWLIQKERHDSPHKIDLAVAAVLSWEARTDAIASGALVEKKYQVLILGGTRR